MTATITDSKTAGSCNGCNSHSMGPNSPGYEVAEVELKSVAFRLCQDCVSRLQNILSELDFTENPAP
jgi:hypothetical protein